MPYKNIAEGRNLHAKYIREVWYPKNRDKQISANMKRRDALAQWFIEYKASLSCSSCGASHPGIIEFHHPNGLQDEPRITGLSNLGWGKAKIIEAISRCVILCANCHAKLHWLNAHQGYEPCEETVSPPHNKGESIPN